MTDRPSNSGWQPASGSLEFNWKPIDPTTGRPTDAPVAVLPGDQQRPGQPIDTTRVGDRPVTPATPGTLELSYKDPNFDQKLAQANPATLRINDFPQGVSISSWVDNNGFYFWYRGGTDNRKPHYVPPGLKTIEVNGFAQNVDEMRIQASMAHLQEQDRSRIGFSAVNGRTNPLEFAQRMGAIGAQELVNQEKWLRQAADASPNNPYFRIYLSDVLLAQAFKPIVDQLAGGGDRIELNTPVTQQKLNEAFVEADKAAKIAQQYGGVRNPNVDMMPGLFPFSLNPYNRNPDMYWGGALYQAYQRQVHVRALQQYVQRFSSVELPPILPPR